MECTFSKFGGMFVKIRVMMLVSLNEVWYSMPFHLKDKDLFLHSWL